MQTGACPPYKLGLSGCVLASESNGITAVCEKDSNNLLDYISYSNKIFFYKLFIKYPHFITVRNLHEVAVEHLIIQKTLLSINISH